MPGNPTPICKQNPIKQVSTVADCNERVEQDLSQIFATLNRMLRCQSAMADAIDSLTGGSFGSGSGTSSGSSTGGATNASGTGTINDVGNPQQPFVYRMSTGTDIQLPDMFSGMAMVDATADITVSLPTPIAANMIVLIHVGAAHTITLKDDLGNTITTIAAGGRAMLIPLEDNTNLPLWPQSADVYFTDGSIKRAGKEVYPSGAGPCLISPDGSSHLLTVSNTGVVGSTTTGALLPEPSDPITP